MAALLDVKELRAGYGVIEVLKGISLHVDPGEIVTVIGANGAGKTTTLNCVSGIVKTRGGSIVFAGNDLGRVAAHDIVKLGLAQSPEGRKIFPRLTVLENLQMGAFTRSDEAGIKEDIRQGLSLFPDLEGSAQTARRHAIGRRTADARHCPSPDGPAEIAAARRTVARLGPDDRRQDLRGHPRLEPPGNVGLARRTKRSHGP